MTDSEGYRRELEQVVAGIGNVATSVEVCGDGAARFVYAATSRRCLELSREASGFYVEFWLDSEHAASHEQTYSTLGEAILAARTWLTEA